MDKSVFDLRSALFVVILSASVTAPAKAVAVAQQPPTLDAPQASAQTAAPTDLMGYWVSVVTEDWRLRMLTPPKGDLTGIPLNAQGEERALAWDYAEDMAAGNECMAYGAGGIMRMPIRLHITWQDENTLRIETDAGQQTKLLHFSGVSQDMGPHTLQGHSVGEWIDVRAGRGGEAPSYGNGGMKVVTTNVSPGYLRKNGAPYSENAVVTEYFDRVPGPDDMQWLIVKTIVEDPMYLTQPYITSAHFLLEPDASKWQPGPCLIDPPLLPPEPERVTSGAIR